MEMEEGIVGLVKEAIEIAVVSKYDKYVIFYKF